MEGFKIAGFVLILWGFQICTIQCLYCEIQQNISGEIISDGNFADHEKCWAISVARGHFIQLKLNNLKSSHLCQDGYVKLNFTGISDVYEFCSTDKNQNPITGFGNVTVIHRIEFMETSSSFELKYSIKSIECINENSFKCDDNSCVSAEEVCDGVKDCKNGADEIGCETGVLSIEGVTEAREKAISWLKRKRTAAWGWSEKTPRAVVALYLTSGANFNGTNLEEELMAKQTEVKTAVALLRPSLTISELNMLINGLLVTCRNPRKFYGNDLVKLLKEKVEAFEGLTHPLAYLALCNANESWPQKALSDLKSILNTFSNYPFKKDLQAIAVMALSCEENRSRNIDRTLSKTTVTLYQETIQQFLKLQAPDGSFGNVHTTALITQALLSSGQEQINDWNLNSTIKYLMNEINSPSVNFLTIYLTLPILNGKSLMDISNRNCSANPWRHGNVSITESVSENSEYLGPKIRVQYSLYIGDEKDVIHTMSLRVLENSTAFKVMELAEVQDPKYKFERKTTSGELYVYEIAGVTNDPEALNFWLLYVGSTNSTEPLTHLTNGPEKIVMHDGTHLVLWYKTAMI